MRTRAALSCVVALLAASCEQVQSTIDPPARAEDTAVAFVEAWNDLDAEAMEEHLADTGAWDAQRLQSLLRRALPDDAISSLEVVLEGPVEQPSDEALIADDGPQATTSAAYSITYDSDASVRPVSFEGELPLAYQRDTDSWSVSFDRELLWPDHPRATGFAVVEKWPRRAAILDRSGQKLAVGGEDSRRYPFGSLAGTTIGHLEPGEEVDRLQGASGLELGLDEVLAGIATQKLILQGKPSSGCRQKRGRGNKNQEDTECTYPTVATLGRVVGKPGRDVKTTLDVDVQRAAEQAYGATTGGSVVMDPATGDLLAIVSSSPFDPNNYVGVAGIEPFNRALSGRYPPGSSLKVMTAAAALEEKVVKETTTLPGPAEYRGVRNFESGAFGTIDFASALKFSVNTVFAQVALDLGARRLKRYADAFGFNSEPRMPLAAATSSFPLPADEGDVMWGSIGQAQVLASPLTMATVAATIANGGKRMEPRILLRDPKVGERVVSQRIATTMTRLMENVVKGGTGVGAAISGAQVAGKTGTAEVDVAGERKNHAWFIAFAPSTAPRVAVSVVSEYGGIGGQVAAPLAGRILSAVLPQL
ncbi:MAG: peptidoglycan D,D-transpeptidase FtsI family protein [Actinomycetota bacterium]